MPNMDAVSDVACESPNSGHCIQSEAKRRKVRKGTRSCWECKRRKIRCLFSTPSDSVCLGCQRRGTSCVSQEYPDEMAPAASSRGRGRYMGDQIVRVEALIEQLVEKVGNRSNSSTARATSSVPSEDGGPNTVIPTPGSSSGESTRFLTMREPPGLEMGLQDRLLEGPCSTPAMQTPESMTATSPSRVTRWERISAALHAALPPHEDIHLMIKAGIDISIHKIITHPLAVLAQRPGGGKANLADIPKPNTHPALLAKYLLMLATCLQFAHPELHAEVIRDLSEPPRQLICRFADTAMGLVTNNDEFLGSLEGLECIMLEAMYQANGGNLRRAWFACRRAMVVAQMMGIHRNGNQPPLKVIDPREPVYPSYIWYRIVCTDRQLSLMLGLPQGSLDVSIASEAALASDTPNGRFERKMNAIASRILERNESSDPAVMDNFTALQEIDAELQKAASEMPSKWWLVPDLVSVGNDSEKIFWEMLRLLDQVFYLNLLNLLHLPYMLRSSTPDPGNGGGDAVNSKYEYSKLTSANASRELLTRFIMFRSFNRVAFCCRSVDFFALTASMTLVIAHLDEHRKRRQRQRQHGVGVTAINVLAHQRNGDRAMMEQVLENMEGVAQLNMDALSERSSSLLKSLLTLEADAAIDTDANMNQDGFTAASAIAKPHSDSATDDAQFLRIDIPYFGTIRIGREGVVSMETLPHAAPPPPMQQQQAVPTETVMYSPAMRASKDDCTVAQGEGCSGAGVLPPVRTSLDGAASEMPPVPQQPQFPSAISDTLQQQYLYPGLTAGADDWAFQGVDMAFFDSLIRGIGGENIGDGGSGPNWEGVS